MKLYILRHGQTDMNDQKRIQGTIDAELSEVGFQQAREIREILLENHIEFDKVYSSPLRRARYTCETVTGLAPGEYEVDDRLQELCFGAVQGIGYDDLPPEQRAFFRDPANYVPDPAGETFDEMFARIDSFFEDMKRVGGAEDRILVATHGAVIHGMLLMLENKDLKDFWDVDVHNCDVLVFELRDGRFHVTDEKYEVPHRIVFDYLGGER
ncbi:MAG: histidine phosphatase family protein [Mogibacterium sp.]|nr:histidine phosphatase family protein [Mogibacterium sp.]